MCRFAGSSRGHGGRRAIRARSIRSAGYLANTCSPPADSTASRPPWASSPRRCSTRMPLGSRRMAQSWTMARSWAARSGQQAAAPRRAWLAARESTRPRQRWAWRAHAGLLLSCASSPAARRCRHGRRPPATRPRRGAPSAARPRCASGDARSRSRVLNALEPRPPRRLGLEVKTGGVLLSQALAGQVPSALRGLTALFGMGRGVSPSP
jgi:hypothetical protein